MPSPYRRRKKKGGPYVGNYFVAIEGRELNLKTKDGTEAHRRARLAVSGKWPPADAAADAGAAALDPTGDAAPSEPAPPEPVPLPVAPAPAEPATPPAAEVPPEPLHVAAAAVASEMGGEQREAEQAAVGADAQSKVDAQLAEVMAELGRGAGGADLVGNLCTMVAGLMLAAEKKTIEWGGDWFLKRRQVKGVRVQAGDPDALMHKALAAGLHGYALLHFPDFAAKLTPGWAVVVGLTGGAATMMIGAKLVETTDKATDAARPMPAAPVPA